MKREVIVMTGRKLTKQERRDFKKRNPGKRLCFRLRFPNFPLYLSMIAVVIAVLEVMALLLK